MVVLSVQGAVAPLFKSSRFRYSSWLKPVQLNLVTPDWAVNELLTLTGFKSVINFTRKVRLLYFRCVWKAVQR